MAANGARLADMDLPDFGRPDAVPVIPSSVYADRVDRLRVRMGETGHDFLVVYADREHSANLSYLTGFDPRFEEAVLVVGGAADDEVRSFEALAAMLPQGRFVEIPGNHMSAVTRAELGDAIVSFLTA